jgi:hypothetical protein
MKHERNVEGLRQNAQKKREEAIKRTDAGIQQLLKEKRPVNFKTVAEVAGVSTAWLYREPEIKARIEQLREQASQTKKVPPKQRASDASKDAMIKTLKSRISKLDADNRELRKQLEVVYGQLIETETLRQRTEQLKAENLKLQTQLKECVPSKPPGEAVKPTSKVTSLADRRAARLASNNDVESVLATLGVEMNSTLAKRIKGTPKEVMMDAIASLEQAIAEERVRNPAGFLFKALNEAWKPNEEHQKKVEQDIFQEWFPLAKSLKLVDAATQLGGVQHVLTTEGNWVPFSQMIAEYPLETLQEMS